LHRPKILFTAKSGGLQRGLTGLKVHEDTNGAGKLGIARKERNVKRLVNRAQLKGTEKVILREVVFVENYLISEVGSAADGSGVLGRAT
jgi:hypothetical protein